MITNTLTAHPILGKDSPENALIARKYHCAVTVTSIRRQPADPENHFLLRRQKQSKKNGTLIMKALTTVALIDGRQDNPTDISSGGAGVCGCQKRQVHRGTLPSHWNAMPTVGAGMQDQRRSGDFALAAKRCNNTGE